MAPTKAPLRLAIIKDWLTSYGGSEEQLAQVLSLYPTAEIFTSVYDTERLPQFRSFRVSTMALPAGLARGRRFEWLLPLLPHYFKNLSLTDYDLVLSITSGFAKGVRTPGVPHICICNTPIRFAWGFGGDDRGWVSRLTAPYWRWYDRRSSADVDEYLANSRTVAARIRQVYGRHSQVLYPPVDVDRFATVKRSSHPVGLITIGRLVPYKRVELIVQAANQLQLPLTVVGEGPEKLRLRRLAGPTVKLTGFVSDREVKRLLGRAAAFVFAAEEDFGIAPVEAMAAGCPVIAYARGGATETVKDGQSGMFFREQSVTSLCQALRQFPQLRFSDTQVRASARRFSADHFRRLIQQAVMRATAPDFRRLK